MKITYIGHASILVEAAGISVLSDPWWRGPCFGAQWWNYPPPNTAAIDGRQIDYIYISHGHHDHFHSGTLSTLSKHAKVLVSARIGLASSIKKLGFEVIEVSDNEAVTLGAGLSCRIMQTHGDDTLMTISDGAEVCLNLNDALHSAPDTVQREFTERLKSMHPRINYVFCGYGVASHFPNCYVVPDKNREATAVNRQKYFNRQWAGIIAALDPAYGFPFAADVVFLEDDLFWVNEITHNAERPTAAFHALYPKSHVVTKDIAPGFIVENGVVTSEVLRHPVLAADIRNSCSEQVERANRHGTIEEKNIREVEALLNENLAACAGYLNSYDGDYRILLRFRNSEWGYYLDKKNGRLSLTATQAPSTRDCDCIYTTRLPYLKWALTSEFGNEILFVGSGGIFEYCDRTKAKTNVHRELIRLIRRDGRLPRARMNVQSRLINRAKRLLKRALGRNEIDLYDLNEWTVYYDRPA